jgi:transposase
LTASAGDRPLYALRQGIEGTLSQAVRGFGLRCARYRGLAKTHLQHVATAAALDPDRVAAWLQGRPLAPARISRFGEHGKVWEMIRLRREQRSRCC